ncbi:hypothetical protein SAMN05660284_01489 [Formivibrio citricus]|uniref:SnoaL-like domain-containing protein n=1 Tax=Formivibrio citricus TaxID=83765 RepID=A0A1I4Z1F2_9NEIS|nr:hypothetical protein [Formivibrio citricus]SFN44058.1 hypothetical protein SAMN05660284_01489 [Formivibrio citricus]
MTNLLSCCDGTVETDRAQLVEEIGEFFEVYGQAFSRLDVDGITAMFTLPFTSFHEMTPSQWGINEGPVLYEVTRSILNHYKERGITGMTYRLASLLAMGRDMASVVVTWTAHCQDRTSWNYDSGYHLIRQDGQWKIYGVIQFDERF